MKKILSLLLAVIMIVCTVPMAFAQGKTYEVGDIIEFGSYPQSEVKDKSLIAELNALATELNEWISYDYYWGTINNLAMVHDWMKYIDVEYDGNKYRGVNFIKYRPDYTNGSTEFTCQDDNGYLTNITYWFKFEPVKWRVLDPKTGFVMSEILIDSQAYSNTFYDDGKDTGYSYFNDPDYKIYANDYETSSIRKWLNEDFYNTAFTNIEKKKINTTTLNNDATDFNGIPAYSRNETNDKIFLLSYEDALNTNFFINETFLSAECSDYAKCQGLEVTDEPGTFVDGKADWFLRTPTDLCSGESYTISCDGYSGGFWVNITSRGVRPALKFNDINDLDHKHEYSAQVKAPTCTDKGYTTYNCECSDSYVSDYVDKLEHKDSNGDYKCDYDCGYEFEKPAPEVPDEPEKELNFFQKIIQWFKDLFNKIFGRTKK